MRLATFTHGSTTTVGLVYSGRIIPISELGDFPDSMRELIIRGPREWKRLQAAAPQTGEQGIILEQVQLLAPIPRPPKNVICLGLNYAAHAAESATARNAALSLPEHPVVFTKAPTTVNTPYGDIPYDPAVSDEMDWEIELGVIIGVPGRGIPVERALEHVFGYTVINDVTARDMQRRHKQFFLGKSVDGSCPMGPWIVTPDEISDPQALRLRTWVNGNLKQDGSTANQIFDIATTISVLSRAMTLEAGDVIATGTPEGVGFARTPPEFLRPGDMVECEIDEIGRLRNRVVPLDLLGIPETMA